MKRVFQKNSSGKTVIGVVGLAPGLGTTHLAITLAHYVEERWGARVAILECNSNNDFRGLMAEGKKLSEKSFSLFGVHYFANVFESEIVNLLNQAYDYYILDFGNDIAETGTEFLRCDRKIIIGSTAAWRRKEYVETKKYFDDSIGVGWHTLCVAGMAEDKKDTEKLVDLHLEPIPYLENPFQTKREQFGFLEHFL